MTTPKPKRKRDDALSAALLFVGAEQPAASGAVEGMDEAEELPAAEQWLVRVRRPDETKYRKVFAGSKEQALARYEKECGQLEETGGAVELLLGDESNLRRRRLIPTPAQREARRQSMYNSGGRLTPPRH